MERFVSEDYFRLGDLPVMVCVLTLSNDSLTIGYSASRPEKYDDGVARVLAKRNAVRQHEGWVKRREVEAASRRSA